MDMSEARCDALLRARRHLTEPLLDQVGSVAGGAWEREQAEHGGGWLVSHPRQAPMQLHAPATNTRCSGLPPPPHCLAQLPPLRALQRLLDELAFGVSSQQPAATPARLIVEQARCGVRACGSRE